MDISPISAELNGDERGNGTNSLTQHARQQFSTPTPRPITISDDVVSWQLNAEYNRMSSTSRKSTPQLTSSVFRVEGCQYDIEILT